MKSDNFDWHEYYELANSFLNEEDIAKLRTGMGRYYGKQHIFKSIQ